LGGDYLERIPNTHIKDYRFSFCTKRLKEFHLIQHKPITGFTPRIDHFHTHIQAKQQKEDEQQKENKEKKDIPPSVSEKLKEMEMSEEKAKMILEAMKNQEIQYLQQNKRKATKPKDKGKPDW